MQTLNYLEKDYNSRIPFCETKNLATAGKNRSHCENSFIQVLFLPAFTRYMYVFVKSITKIPDQD